MTTATWITAALLGLVVFATAPEVAPETRRHVGVGSLGMESAIDLYLVGGGYQHAIEVDEGCFVTVGLFPSSHQEPRVDLWDVIHADLQRGPGTVTGPQAPARGDFTIGEAGWAELQLGTGPDCRWTYAITGRFVPPGKEPIGPLGRTPIGVAVPVLVVALVGVVLVVARRRAPDGHPAPPPVQVKDPRR